MARPPRNKRKEVAAVIVMYFEFFFRILMFIMKLIEEIHTDLLESREVQTAWETPTARQIARRSFMNAITSHGNVSSVMLIRMNCRCFQKLCHLLVTDGGLRGSWNIDIDEMVAIFLYTIAHNEKNRILQVVFRRSGETISRVIHSVLFDVLKLHKILYRKTKPITENSTEPRWKYFKNCLGALDGTIITVRVPRESQQRYRTRKGTLGINVLGVCNSNLEFIYTLAGWEGSAHDGRVLRDAFLRPNGLKVPRGYYYLCDAGYSNYEGFLAPYRGQRYHLKEWGTTRNRPRTPEELFNMRHSQARNTIERAFGVLKMRWAILRDTTWFDTRTVGRVVNACCLLHSFIRGEVGADVYERLYRDEEHTVGAGYANDAEEFVTHIEASAEWTQFRQDMTQHLWNTRGWST